MRSCRMASKVSKASRASRGRHQALFFQVLPQRQNINKDFVYNFWNFLNLVLSPPPSASNVLEVGFEVVSSNGLIGLVNKTPKLKWLMYMSIGFFIKTRSI